MAKEAVDKLELSENAFAATVLTARLSTTCSYCCSVSNQTTISKLSRCSKCKFVYYCNGQCQTDDWSHHKRECQRLRRFLPIMDENGVVRRFPDGLIDEIDQEYARQFPDESMRLVGRMMDVWDRSVSTFSSGGRRLDSLEAHVQEIEANPVTMQQFNAFCSFYEFYCTGDGSGGHSSYDKTKLLKMYGLCRSNAVCIKDAAGTEAIGCGIYVNLRRFSHSCKPNAKIIACGRRAKVVVFANWNPTRNDFVTPTITSYDQIYCSYIDCVMPKKERRRILKDIYFIDCHCDCCEFDQQRNDAMEALRCDSPVGCDGLVVWQENASDGDYKCRSCGKTYEDQENAKLVLKLTKELLDISAVRQKAVLDPTWAKEVYANLACMQIPTLHRHNISFIRSMKSSYEAACRLGNWADASAYGNDMLEGYKLYMNEDSDPEFAVIALNVAKARINDRQKAKAMKLLEKCLRCFKYAFDSDSYLCQEASKLIELCN